MKRPLKALYAVLLVILIPGCVRPEHPIPPDPTEDPRWTFTTDFTPRGVFLVVHGLNLRPSALDPLCGFLAQRGYHSFRMTLHGHNGTVTDSFQPSEWQHDVVRAYTQVRERFPKLPVYTLGYSIGGLLLTNMFDTNPKQHYPRGMILIAPALSLRTLLDVSTALQIPPPLSWSVPNVAPPEYRRYELTPLFWYSNTLALYSTMDPLTNAAGLKTIPTLVVLNPDDELVSLSGTERWIAENHLAPEWRIALVQKETNEHFLKEHLMLDSTSLGLNGWERMKSILSEFLDTLKN